MGHSSFDDLPIEPTEADLASAADDVRDDDLKKKRLLKHLGKEGQQDDVRYMLETLCDHKLLNAAQERELAELVATSRAAYEHVLHEQAKAEHVSADDMLKLERLSRAFIENRKELVRHNLRLVVSIAKRFRGLGQTLVELVADGNTGLMRAVDKFEHDRGFRFSTYASWWIRQTIQNGLARSRLIPVSPQVITDMYALRTAEDRYHQEHHEKPSRETLAQILGISVERIDTLRRAYKHPERLDALLGGDDEDTRAALHADTRTSQAEQDMHHADVSELFDFVLSETGLPQNDIDAFLWSTGLKDGVPHKPAEIGKLMGQSPSRVKQFIERARRTLERHPKLLRLLKEKRGHHD